MRFAVDRTDKLVLVNRNQYRARFPANLIRRRYAIDFAQRCRIRCSQRLNVRMIARGLNVDIQRLTRAQIRHLTMGIALQTERVHPRLIGKPVIQIIERIVVRRGRAARTGIRLLNRRKRRRAANAVRRQVVVTLERAHRVLRIPAVVAGDLSVVILQRRQRGLDVANRRAGGAEGIVAARIAAAAVVLDVGLYFLICHHGRIASADPITRASLEPAIHCIDVVEAIADVGRAHAIGAGARLIAQGDVVARHLNHADGLLITSAVIRVAAFLVILRLGNCRHHIRTNIAIVRIASNINRDIIPLHTADRICFGNTHQLTRRQAGLCRR